MIQTINVSGLNPEQIKQIQATIEEFKAKNKLERSLVNRSSGKIPDIINSLTDNPIKVNGVLAREDIYDR